MPSTYSSPLRGSQYHADGTPYWSVEEVPAGETATDLLCGDVVLIEGVGWLGALIRRIDRSRFSHAVSVLGSDGMLADMQYGGIAVSDIEDYRDRHYVVIRFRLNQTDRLQAARYLSDAVDADWRYSYLTFCMVKFSQLTKTGLIIRRGRSAICSGLAASHMMVFGVYHPVYSPAYNTPSSVADVLGVERRRVVG